MKFHVRIVLLILCALGSIVSLSQAEPYKRAPDVIPGTLPEMRDPSYWIARMEKPDEIILSQVQIQRMNENYRQKIHSEHPFKGANPDRIPNANRLLYRQGHVIAFPDLDTMSPVEIADSVRRQITREISFMLSGHFANVASIEYSEREIDAFEREMAIDLLGKECRVQYGITVRTARQRIIPSWLPQQEGYPGHGTHCWDQWNLCVIKIASPVSVLHRSRTGAYVFVLSEDGYGWLNSEDVAFADRDVISSYMKNDRFILCTGDRVPYYSDDRCLYVSGWLRMGAHLPLSDGGNPRIIQSPVRKTDGTFAVERAWLASEADVHAGYLPYTRRNIVTTAFKLLDNTYDWTGGWYGRNHDSNLRDIFACFGFKLPYEGLLFTHFGDDDTIVYPKMDRKAQYAAILRHEPFVTLMNCESGGPHSNLLLGEYNGTPIVFDMHGYNYQREDGVWLEIRRCCVGDITMPNYFLKNRVTFLGLKLPILNDIR
ncbi:MAG: SH3 domain-containing protein [Candidatus Latescibacter sp.]|nr:SH3 domain-containing protein [Candidatus Latescibacter sp.]